ncbi:hypothetical protein PGT21_033789 [Puccinia graminis f. sp. tritici]|uniref:Pantothenate kinase n=1 Tax=Puccinia graminis f. sp. tritici TaxID=56615 RepID=A0A5B0MIM3_PUCGR|nr:hypothetical protein PGTUg99_035291 [Puccinia graminis f. sp. tritici]KAA1091441.1 hypothetical protein PGT21_033789 [Puccinia graminis f. sp. tritici]
MSHRHLPASTSTLRVDIRGAEILDEDESTETSDIYLPKHTEFISHIALDIGGSLAKVVYFTRAADHNSSRENLSKRSGGSLNQSLPRKPVSTEELSTRERPSRAAVDQSCPSSSSSHSTSSSDPEPPNLPNSRPHSSARSSVSQPNGILNPTVVREEVYNSRARSLDPGNHCNTSNDPIDQDPLQRSSQLNQKLASLSTLNLQDPFRDPKHRLSRSSSISSIPGGRLNFIKFETGSIESECITFISNLIQLSAESNRVPISTMKRGVKIILTGGGAYMYADLIKNALGGDVEVLSEDEMDCLITGLNFITEIPNEVFWFSDQLVQEIIHNNPSDPASEQENLLTNPHKTLGPIQPSSSSSSSHPTFDQDRSPGIEQFPRPSPNPPQYSVLFDSNPSPQFPCMLVNIGSGVSIIKVTNFGKFERISGTSLGGGTLWGLLSLLTEAKSFDEMLDLSIKGDNSKVDMLVGDIYGQDYGKIGLKSSTIASSFGKVFKKKSSPSTQSRNLSGVEDPPKVEFKPEDISKSLLYAISNNIGQIAHLNAEQHGLDRIYFGGCFIRGHAATVSTLSYAIRFWSKGTKRAFFLRHEGYLGSIGAWLKNIGHEIDQASPPPPPPNPS